MQKRLGRDTAHIQAGSTERAALFNTGDLEAELTGPDCTIIAAGAAADDHNIIGLGHGSPLISQVIALEAYMPMNGA